MSERMVETVRESYGRTARARAGRDGAAERRVAAAFGYAAEDLASIPEQSNLGVSCGNPVALASLRPGETVVDLGSGGGIDVFLAARAVGPEGRAIGIDMTDDMLELARANAAEGGFANAEFRRGRIEALPLDDGSVDVVISNCVLNLVPDKPKAFAEIHRVLRPGGRLAVSDIALRRELPPALAESVAAYVGCIAGAIPIAEYERGLREAGFSDVVVVDAGSDLNVYKELEGEGGCCEPGCCGSGASSKPGTDGARDRDRDREDLDAVDFNAYAASVKVFAVKPA